MSLLCKSTLLLFAYVLAFVLITACSCHQGWRHHAVRRIPNFLNAWFPFNHRVHLHRAVYRPQPSLMHPAFLVPPDLLPQQHFGNMGLQNSIHAPMLNEEEVYEDDEAEEDHEPVILGREEVFSYSPHVIGSGYANQPSYNAAPGLSKHDISRYANIYRYDWQENERSSHQPADEPLSSSPSFPALLRSVRKEQSSLIDAKKQSETPGPRRAKPMMERHVLITRKRNVKSSAAHSAERVSTVLSTAAPRNAFPPEFTTIPSKNKVRQETTTAPTSTVNSKSKQVPAESITEMIKILKRRPVGLFENKLMKLREERLKMITNARGKPKKPVVIKFMSK